MRVVVYISQNRDSYNRESIYFLKRYVVYISQNRDSYNYEVGGNDPSGVVYISQNRDSYNLISVTACLYAICLDFSINKRALFLNNLNNFINFLFVNVYNLISKVTCVPFFYKYLHRFFMRILIVGKSITN